MKGLLIKDVYILFSSMKVFFILMVIFAVIPETFTQGFAIMYASLIPITALAYDERAKWKQLAAMMPYRKRDLVVSKYLLGIIMCVSICIIEIASNLVRDILSIKVEMPLTESLTIIGIIFATACILLSFNLPIVFKLGAERGRLVYLFVSIGVSMVIVNMISFDSIAKFGSIVQGSTNILVIALIAIAIIILLISMAISKRVYENGFN